MSKEMQVFKNEEFGSVRVILIDGNPWFIGQEVSGRLGYSDRFAALKQHVSKEYKRVVTRKEFEQMASNQVTGKMPDSKMGGAQRFTIINEAGLYQLIFSSELESAEKFRRWIFEEVLPSIRKYGVYATNNFLEKSIADPTWAIGVLTALKAEQDKNKQLTKENEIMQPKAKYYDEVLNSASLITITSIAKQYGLSGQTLNRLLYAWGIQYDQGDIWVLYQDYANEGYAFYEEFPYTDSDGVQQTHQLLKWTQKGKEFLHKILISHGYKQKRSDK